MEDKDKSSGSSVDKQLDAKPWWKKALLFASNFFHTVFLLLMIFFTGRVIIVESNPPSISSFKDILDFIFSANLTDIFTFIGAIAFILFGFVGIYEYAYLNDLRLLVPPYYIHLKERNDEKAAEIMMKVYYEKDLEFIQQYEKERVNSILTALKINDAQFRHLSYEIVKARSMPTKNLHQLRMKASKIFLDKRFIQDLNNLEPCRRVYDDVNYFVNLYTAFYDSKLRSDAGRIMANFITLCMGADALSRINYIVIPSGSNLLLGLEVGEILGKKTICMLEKPRTDRQKPWDGEYVVSDPTVPNHIIILHDVLVTGEKICDIAKDKNKMLPSKTYQMDGLFCLIKYNHTNYTPEANIVRDFGIDSTQIHCLLNVDEKQLAHRIERK